MLQYLTLLSGPKNRTLLGSKPEFQLDLSQVKVGDWIGYYNTDESRARGGGKVTKVTPKYVMLSDTRGFKIGGLQGKGSRNQATGEIKLSVGSHNNKLNGWKVITQDQIAHVKQKGI
jgi:hypothetical protein